MQIDNTEEHYRYRLNVNVQKTMKPIWTFAVLWESQWLVCCTAFCISGCTDRCIDGSVLDLITSFQELL